MGDVAQTFLFVSPVLVNSEGKLIRAFSGVIPLGEKELALLELRLGELLHDGGKIAVCKALGVKADTKLDAATAALLGAMGIELPKA